MMASLYFRDRLRRKERSLGSSLHGESMIQLQRPESRSEKQARTRQLLRKGVRVELPRLDRLSMLMITMGQQLRTQRACQARAGERQSMRGLSHSGASVSLNG